VSEEGFSGQNGEIWIRQDDLTVFISELQVLERKRSGSAALTTMTDQPEYRDLKIEFYAIDKLGHIGISVELQRGR
jgi:hypothetical protein